MLRENATLGRNQAISLIRRIIRSLTLSHAEGLLLVAFLYNRRRRGPDPLTLLSLPTGPSSLSAPADDEARALAFTLGFGVGPIQLMLQETVACRKLRRATSSFEIAARDAL